ncbi:MAG: tetratricopeptide repeat protein [Calditrichae bacterium]|nr:tetratricopeptide repeat protein [Calditrichia bacterium]
MSVIKEMVHRRVPQIFGLYLGGSWAAIQYVDWLVNRYGLSSYLTDIAQVTLVSLIPTVLLLAYFHGAPNRQKWGRLEKIGIPVNALITAGLLFFLFSGKSLDAASQTVTIEDEYGKQMKRSIPTENARRRLALFAFDNQSKNNDLDWLQHGISFALFYDLSQNMFLDLWSSEWLQDRVEAAGFSNGVNIPFALKQKIARDMHLDFVITGNYQSDGENLQLDSEIYQTKLGKKIAGASFRGDNYVDLIDSVAIFIKNNVDLPEQSRINAVDLPLSEILTSNADAFENYAKGRFANNFRKDYATAQQLFEKAVADDPTFASALWDLSGVYLNNGQEVQGKTVLEKAMKHHYKLPERNQFYLKSFYYFVNQEIDKQFALLKMWTELYPQDVNAHLNYGSALNQRNNFDGAIKQWQIAADLDPEKQYILHNIGFIQFKKGDFESALASYRRYAEAYPNEYRSFYKLGDMYEDLGDFAAAKSNFEKALLLEPGGVAAKIALARVSLNTGNPVIAGEMYADALASCTSLIDSTNVLDGIMRFYQYKGQVRKALDIHKKRLALLKRSTNPLSFNIEYQILGIEPFVEAQDFDGATKILANTKNELPESLKKLVAFGELRVFLRQKDIPRAEAALVDVIAGIDLYKREELRHFVQYARGIIAEAKGKPDSALAAFQSRIEMEPWREIHVSTNLDIVRCYRKLGKFVDANQLVKKLLKIAPHSPGLQMEMGHLAAARGDNSLAITHFERALEIWADAEPDFRDAILAREMLGKLRPTS